MVHAIVYTRFQTLLGSSRPNFAGQCLQASALFQTLLGSSRPKLVIAKDPESVPFQTLLGLRRTTSAGWPVRAQQEQTTDMLFKLSKNAPCRLSNVAGSYKSSIRPGVDFLFGETFVDKACNQVCVNGDPSFGKPLVGCGGLVSIKIKKLS